MRRRQRTSACAAVSSSAMAAPALILAQVVPAKHASRSYAWLRERCSRVAPPGAAPRGFSTKPTATVGYRTGLSRG